MEPRTLDTESLLLLRAIVRITTCVEWTVNAPHAGIFGESGREVVLVDNDRSMDRKN
jgi:hypothetical protein